MLRNDCHLDHGRLPHGALGALARNLTTGEEYLLLDPDTIGTSLYPTVLAALGACSPEPCTFCGVLVGRLDDLAQVR